MRPRWTGPAADSEGAHLATAKESYTLTGVYSNDAWCFQPDGKQLATGNSDGSITIWNAASGDEVVSYKPEGAKAQVGNLHFLAQAKQLIGSDVNTTIVRALRASCPECRRIPGAQQAARTRTFH